MNGESAARALAPQPLAQALLRLAVGQCLVEEPDPVTKRFEGTATFGGRVLKIKNGRVVDVIGAAADPSLFSLAVASGHIAQSPAEAPRGGTTATEKWTSERERLRRAGLSERMIQRIRRATWVDRLVGALTESDGTGPELSAETIDADPADGEALGALLLDALARRAGENEAGVVGGIASMPVEFGEDGVHAEIARRWGGLRDEDEGRPIASVLGRSPGAASRLAALFRTGVVRCSAIDAAPPASDSAAADSDVDRSSLTPPIAPERNWAPGSLVPPPSGRVEVDSLPPVEGPLGDPLVATERRILELEANGAPGPERAAVWKEAARLWQQHHGALEEAARALREATAADPSDPDCARLTSRACLALGQLDLARAYARTATDAAPSPATLALARMEQARLATLASDTDEARSLLDLHLDHANAAIQRLGLEREDSALAEIALRLRTTLPDATRAVLADLARRHPNQADPTIAWAEALAQDGYAPAGVSLLCERARASNDDDQSRSLRWCAAEMAEEYGLTEQALLALLDAHIAEPHVDLYYAPLVQHSGAAEDDAWQAVLLEHLGRSSDDGGQWRLQSARTFERLPGGAVAAFEAYLMAAWAGELDGLEGLTRVGRTDAGRLADALERLGDAAPVAVRRAALRQLVQIATEELDAPRRALQAWEALASLDEAQGDEEAHGIAVLRTRSQREEEHVERARRAKPSREASRRLALFLRNDPRHRTEAIELYREILNADPRDASAAATLESLLRASGDKRGWRTHLADRAALAHKGDTPADRVERGRILAELTLEASWRGDLPAALDTATEWLAVSPDHPEVIARVELLARLTRSDDAARLAREARLALPPHRLQARALVLAAREARTPLQAMQLCSRALQIAPTLPEAHVDLMDSYSQELSDAQALDALERAQSVLGPDPRRTRSVIDRVDDSACALLWARCARMAPHDAALARERLEDMIDRGLRHELQAASEALLRVDGASAAELIIRAATWLHEEDGSAEAVELLLRSADLLADSQLVRRAQTMTAALPAARAACLERLCADDLERSRALRGLASIYRRMQRPSTECRTLLRWLAEEEPHPAVLDRLEELFARHGDEERLTAVLELKLERAPSPEERRRVLKRLAKAAFERRLDLDATQTYLERLAHDEGAADQAAALWVKLGDPRRAIELLEQHAQTSVDRAQSAASLELAVRLLEHEVGDGEAALELAARALSTGHRTPELMLTFERLALAAGALELAQVTYQALRRSAMGRHGERGALYRQARWLERAEAVAAAVEAYARCFELAPSDGAVLRALERLASSLSDTGGIGRGAEELARALALLSEHQSQPEARAAYARRAAQLFEEELHDPRAAFDLLAKTWLCTQRSALVAELRRLIRTLAERAESVTDLLEILREGLQARVEMTWDVADQVSALLMRAELEAEEGARPAEAARLVEESIASRIEAEPSEFDADAIDEALEALRGHLERRQETAAAAQVEATRARLVGTLRQQENTISDEQAFAFDEVVPAQTRELQAREAKNDSRDATPPVADEDRSADSDAHSDSDPRSVAGSESVADSESVAGSESVDDSESDFCVAEEPSSRSRPSEPTTVGAPSQPLPIQRFPREHETSSERDAVSHGPLSYGGRGAPVHPSDITLEERPRTEEMLSRWQAAAPPTPVPSERSLWERMQAGDWQAAESLGVALAAEESRQRDAQEVLLHVLRKDPSRLQALRVLSEVATRTGAVGVRLACDEIRALFGEVETPHRAGDWMRRIESFPDIVSADRPPMLQVLGLVWEGAQSLFRERLEEHGVVGTRRITPVTRLVGPAFARCAERLQLDRVNAYFHQSGADDFALVASHPPAVLVGKEALRGSAGPLFRFRLGQHMELGRAPHILLATRSAEARQAIVDGLWAAFGPVSAQRTVSRPAAELAADLWRILPTHLQNDIRKLTPEDAQDAQTLYEHAQAHAARAGYVVDGSLASASQVLLDGKLSDPQSYVAALTTTPTFRAVVQLIFDDRCLAARTAEAREVG